MCAFTSQGVAAALKRAAPKSGGDISDSPTITIVATCGTTQKEFDFPYPANVDRKELSLADIKVSHLWDTYYRISEHAFGKDFSFDRLTTTLGTALVPELISGKYQAPFGSRCGDHECDNYLAWLLQGYTEAPQPRDPGVVTLLDADALHLTRYVSPKMSPLAFQARISGDVRLRIFVDLQTGLVRNVEALSGHPLLQQEAVKAAQSWQFAPDALSGDSVEATLRFELRCR
jgi:TonB family protein